MTVLVGLEERDAGHIIAGLGFPWSYVGLIDAAGVTSSFGFLWRCEYSDWMIYGGSGNIEQACGICFHAERREFSWNEQRRNSI
jgi:hypothetical protein